MQYQNLLSQRKGSADIIIISEILHMDYGATESPKRPRIGNYKSHCDVGRSYQGSACSLRFHLHNGGKHCIWTIYRIEIGLDNSLPFDVPI
jgi:hypothetical protein